MNETKLRRVTLKLDPSNAEGLIKCKERGIFQAYVLRTAIERVIREAWGEIVVDKVAKKSRIRTSVLVDAKSWSLLRQAGEDRGFSLNDLVNSSLVDTLRDYDRVLPRSTCGGQNV